jgi:hypothetical protein
MPPRKVRWMTNICVVYGTHILLILYGQELAIVYLPTNLILHHLHLFISSWPINNESSSFLLKKYTLFFASFVVQVAASYFILLIPAWLLFYFIFSLRKWWQGDQKIFGQEAQNIQQTWTSECIPQTNSWKLPCGTVGWLSWIFDKALRIFFFQFATWLEYNRPLTLCSIQVLNNCNQATKNVGGIMFQVCLISQIITWFLCYFCHGLLLLLLRCDIFRDLF